MDTATLVIAIVTSLLGSGAVSALVSGIMARRKTQSEAKSIDRTVDQKAIEIAERTYKQIIDTLKEQVKEYAEHVEKQDIRIDNLQKEIAEQESKIELLVKQLEQLREVNSSLLDKNSELQRKVKDIEDCEKLFGSQG